MIPVGDFTAINRTIQTEDLVKSENVYGNFRQDPKRPTLLAFIEKKAYSLRKRMLSSMFDIHYIRSLEPLMKSCIDAGVTHFNKLCENSSNGTIINTQHFVHGLAIDTIGATTFSGSFHVVKNGSQPLPSRLKAGMKVSAIVQLISWMQHIPFLARRDPCIEKSTNLIVDKRDVQDESVILLAAGSETTANAELFTFMQLLKHPIVMKKLAEEADKCLMFMFNKKAFDFAKITKIVSFGDSWTDTRFNISGQQPSSSVPIGNYGKTSSNGKMWPMYLTTQYNKSSVLLYNMAVGGAVVDKDIVTTGPNDVDTQVHDKFQVYAQQPNLFPPKETLWTVFIGINDIYRTINQTDQEDTIVTIIERIRELTIDLYSYGARQFLFISTPPQSLFPNNRPKDIAPKLKAASESWNKKLRSLVHHLDHELAHSTFFFFDIVPLITAVTDDPSQFPETAIYKSNSFCTDYKAGTPVPDFKSDSASNTRVSSGPS
ncbi:hypothetical protein FGRMN_11104 [Fusarium graminum]|nr:hypothetical protein FGRMN_11104 [Fusarium graminum]